MSATGMKPGRAFGSTLAAAFAVAAACSGKTSAPAAGTTAALPFPLGPSTQVVSEVQSNVAGLTPTETAYGIGGILYYAQRSMQPVDFKQVASAFPGSDALIDRGTRLGMPSEMYGLTSLSGTLKNAGISRDQLNQMIPAMTGIVDKKSGPEVAEKFAAVFQ